MSEDVTAREQEILRGIRLRETCVEGLPNYGAALRALYLIQGITFSGKEPDWSVEGADVRQVRDVWYLYEEVTRLRKLMGPGRITSANFHMLVDLARSFKQENLALRKALLDANIECPAFQLDDMEKLLEMLPLAMRKDLYKAEYPQ